MTAPRALGDAARRERASAYARWLSERNGALGPDGRTLARREGALCAAEAWAWPPNGRVDRATYRANLARRRPDPSLDRAALWALCLAKASAAESFGAAVGTNFDAAEDPDVAAVLAHIEAEEAYHARTARCLLGALGLPDAPPPPDAFTRALVRVMAWLPQAFGGGVVVYAGELCAAALFRLLRRSLGVAFGAGGEGPALAGRLLDEVVVDEEAHARFAASRLRPIDLGAARLAMPHVVRALGHSLPEAARSFGDDLGREVEAVERAVWAPAPPPGGHGPEPPPRVPSYPR